MLSGDMLLEVSADELQFMLDLGLVRRSEYGGFEIANPIFGEVWNSMSAVKC
jgi:hypothetical protein